LSIFNYSHLVEKEKVDSNLTVIKQKKEMGKVSLNDKRKKESNLNRIKKKTTQNQNQLCLIFHAFSKLACLKRFLTLLNQKMACKPVQATKVFKGQEILYEEALSPFSLSLSLSSCSFFLAF